ncbi:MAG: hypothetical protein PHZ00_06300 [Candidatus Peribacteraceae bacterium]|nr:hypothetical protein [Candidatus Peribacteraceae bacterium]
MSNITPNRQDTACEQAAAQFLERDFDQCFEQMRHYDGQIWDLFKFTLASYTTILGAAVGLYQYSLENGIDFVPVALVLLVVGFLFGLCMYALVIRNRVYFVCVAKYINEHRGFFLKTKPLGFSNASKMFTNLKRPQFFNWRSSQLFFSYLIASLNAILLSMLFYFWLDVSANRTWLLGGTFTITVALQLSIGILYLLSRDQKGADSAVFGIR